MNRIVPLIFISVLSSQALAQETRPLSIFDAARDCTAMPTIDSIRYGMPCRVSPVQVQAAAVSFVDEASILRDLNYLQRLRVSFTCESIFPLNLNWRASSGNAFGDVGARADAPALAVDIPAKYEGAAVEFNMTGFRGMQFMKPGCRANLDSHVVYPQASSFNLYLRLVSRQSRTLGQIFSSISPESGTSDILQALTEAEDALDLLSLGADPVTLVQIEETLTSIRDAKSSLTQNCGAGSGAELCTAQQVAVRQEVRSMIEDIDAELKTAEQFLKNEETRLSRDPSTADVVSELKTVRTRYFPAR